MASLICPHGYRCKEVPQLRKQNLSFVSFTLVIYGSITSKVKGRHLMFHAKFIQTFVCLAMLSVFRVGNYSTFGKHYITFSLDFMVTPCSVTMATDRVSKINKAKISLSKGWFLLARKTHFLVTKKHSMKIGNLF